jgi:hypothetical protein
MQVIIQHCRTGKFLEQNGEWTKDPELAQDFGQSLRAWEEVDRRRLSEVRILLRSEQSNHNPKAVHSALYILLGTNSRNAFLVVHTGGT